MMCECKTEKKLQLKRTRGYSMKIRKKKLSVILEADLADQYLYSTGKQ